MGLVDELLGGTFGRAAARLARRRMARYDRGLPMDLTEPITPEQAAAPPLPVETTASGPHPPSAIIASLLLTVLGGVTAALGVVGLGAPVVGLLTEPAVDGMTKLVHLVFAGFFAAVLLAVLVIAAVHFYAAWRIWNGVNWGWVEGLAVAVAGTAFSVVALGLDDTGSWAPGPPLFAGLAAYSATFAAILFARGWLGPVRFPLNPERAPWWLRLLDRWRQP